jgi:hypothetical protein
MIPISTALSGGLIWSKTPHNRGYELRCNGKIVGSLQRKSCWSSEFRAESADGSWKFRRTGWFHTGTEIADSTSGARIAVYKPNWSGAGTLVFPDGLTFRITYKGFWRPVWTVLTDGGQPILSIRSHGRTVEISKELHLSHLSEERVTLLAMFTWHIMQQTAEDAASAAVAVAVTS